MIAREREERIECDDKIDCDHYIMYGTFYTWTHHFTVTVYYSLALAGSGDWSVVESKPDHEICHHPPHR